jgi:uncharacterized MAPEG superfamily protein
MTIEYQMLGWSVILGLVQVLLATSFAVFKYGLPWAFSNRDKVMPPLEGMGGRTQRASHNFRETFGLFAVLVVVAGALGMHSSMTERGAELYFWGRLAYLPIYMGGIIYLRTAAWAVSLVGILMLLVALL